MTKKEQTSNFLQEWNGDGYTVQDVYIEKECADLMAEGIVKLFSIPLVSKRYYWLKADGTISNMWDEKTHKETIDDEMMEIAKQKGWSLIQINVC